jgi:ATP-dependent Zn protease
MMPIYQSAAAHRDLARMRMGMRQRMVTGRSLPEAHDRFFPTGIHEAGHCCVTTLLEGSQIDSVAIVQTERGGVSGRMRLHNADDLTCAILMGGMAAEITILGFCEKECSSTDLYQARDILRSTCSDDRLIEARLDRELNQTIALLESHRDALLALAREIISKRVLNGIEVNHVISKALVGAH